MLPPQVYASGAPLSWRERLLRAEGLGALMAMAEAMRPGSTTPDGRCGIMQAYGVVICPSCRAGVCRGSRCRGCGRVVAL
jgi:hypothetical protein